MWLKHIVGIGIGATALLAMPVPGWAQGYHLSAVIGLNNTGAGNLPNNSKTFFSFDISWFDPVLHKFFLADRSNRTLDIFDPNTGTFTQVPVSTSSNPLQGFTGFQGFTGNNDTSGPDGVLTANNHSEVWVGDTGGVCLPAGNPRCGPGVVWVLNTDGSVKTLPTGVNPIPVGGTTRADEMCHDSLHGIIMVASPAETPPYVTFISVPPHLNPYQVLGTLVFDGVNAPNATNGIEQCGWSAVTGLFYQNVPEINGPGNDTAPGGIAVINPVSMSVVNVFPININFCAGPQGMAINDVFGQILEGCNAASPNGHRNIVIVDLFGGAPLNVIPDLGGADEVWFNPGNGLYFVPSCNTICRTPNAGPEGIERLGVVGAAPPILDQTVDVAVQTPPVNPAASGNPRTIHSVAASTAGVVFLPIPAVGGVNPQFGSTLCDVQGAGVTIIGTTPVSSATGCIAILSPSEEPATPVATEVISGMQR
jgi:hypothetical protein